MAANLVGGAATAVVSVIIAYTKFMQGAWLVVLLIPVIVACFMAVKRHYEKLRIILAMSDKPELIPFKHRVVVLVSGVHRGIVGAVRYVNTIAHEGEACAIYVSLDPEQTKWMKLNWDSWETGIPLVILESPFRSILRPVLTYLEHLELQGQSSVITVVLPEFVVARWWHHIMHNQTALAIKLALLFKPRMIVTSVPFHLPE